VRLSDAEDDFWVVQAKRACDLLNAREFSEVVVAANGSMARMTTIHPAEFVRFKRWMARQPDREAIKRRRDALQADAVEWLLHERLPQLQEDWVRQRALQQARDAADMLAYLCTSPYDVRLAQERFPKIHFHPLREHAGSALQSAG
jgi:peptide subunit release factor RF-3